MTMSNDEVLSVWIKVTSVTFLVLLPFQLWFRFPPELFWLAVISPVIAFYVFAFAFALLVAVVVWPIWLIKTIWRAV